MPELPEVETVMRGIAPALEGAIITTATAHHTMLRWPVPEDFSAVLTGAPVTGLRRRAKYILVDLKDRPSLLIHLGMSGRITVFGPGTVAPDRAKHDHIVLKTDIGATLVYNDARRFGAWLFVDGPDHALLKDIGPEPLGNDFHAQVLLDAFKGKAAPVKAALLDQKIVAGLGNIYVAEALFRTGIHPKRAAGKLSKARIEALVPAIRSVLQEAIESGGSSLRDHMRVDGELGYFQHHFDVYGREGEACKRQGCNGHIRRIVQSGRSSFYCGTCQK